MRSMHKEEVSNMCVGSLITWCNLNWNIMLSITFPLKVDLSWHSNLLDLKVISLIATKGFFGLYFLNLIRAFRESFKVI